MKINLLPLPPSPTRAALEVMARSCDVDENSVPTERIVNRWVDKGIVTYAQLGREIERIEPLMKRYLTDQEAFRGWSALPLYSRIDAYWLIWEIIDGFPVPEDVSGTETPPEMIARARATLFGAVEA